MKALALASLIAAGAATGAVVVTTTYHYSTDFQTAQPINGAFNVIESPANIWRVTVNENVNAPNNTTPIVVDINDDGVPDWDHPGIAVTITDIGNFESGSALLIDGEVVWRSTPHNSSNQSTTNSHTHFSTPIVVPAGATLEWSSSYYIGVTLIGRVLNY